MKRKSDFWILFCWNLGNVLEGVSWAFPAFGAKTVLGRHKTLLHFGRQFVALGSSQLALCALFLAHLINCCPTTKLIY